MIVERIKNLLANPVNLKLPPQTSLPKKLKAVVMLDVFPIYEQTMKALGIDVLFAK